MWTANWHGHSVSKVHSPDGEILATIVLPEITNAPTAICYDGGSVWLGHSTTVYQIDADTDEVLWQNGTDTYAQDIVITPDAVWLVGCGSGTPDRIVRIDKATHTVTGWSLSGAPEGICYDGRYLWVALYATNAVRRIDPQVGPTDTDLFINGLSEPAYCRYGNGFIWVPLRHTGLAKVTAATGVIEWIKPVGGGSTWGCLPDGDVVWATKTAGGNVVGLSSADGDIVHTESVGGNGCGIVRTGDWIWVACDDALYRFSWKTVSAPSGWFNLGWNYFSIPLDPTGSSEASGLLGFDCTNILYQWNPVAKNIELYPDDFTDLARGRGYLLRLETDQQPSYEAYAPIGDFEIALPEAGWTWIGQPFDHDTLLGDCSIRNNTTDATRTAQEDRAAVDSWLNWNLVWWDSQRDSWILLGLPGTGNDDTYLRPWHGYMVWSHERDLTLIVPSE